MRPRRATECTPGFSCISTSMVVGPAAHPGDAPIAAEDTKADHSFVIGDRSLEVGDLDSDAADVGGSGSR